jgi:hypothetical protein
MSHDKLHERIMPYRQQHDTLKERHRPVRRESTKKGMKENF